MESRRPSFPFVLLDSDLQRNEAAKLLSSPPEIIWALVKKVHGNKSWHTSLKKKFKQRSTDIVEEDFRVLSEVLICLSLKCLFPVLIACLLQHLPHSLQSVSFFSHFSSFLVKVI